LLPDANVLERARLSRDPRFDGRFFMAVTTTGIYCRPICPAAPTPRRAHVRYFPSAAAAAEAGFRPCLRCRPESAPGTPAWLGTSAVVRRALRLIEEGALDEASIDSLAARIGVGPRHLHPLFIRHVGASPMAVAQTRRLHFAKRLLDDTSLPITQIALASGFGSLRRFNDAFRKSYGRAPRELRTASPASELIRLRLAYRPPYDWAFVSAFLAARAAPGVERVDAHGYVRAIALPGGEAIVRIRPVAGRHQLELTVRGAAPAALFALSVRTRQVFDLAADPELTSGALRTDPLLGPIVQRRPGLRIPGVWDPFECAVRAVLGQQVSVAAARTLAGRLVARAGRMIAANAEGLTHLFPAPEQLLQADLTGLGLTGARVAAIRTLSEAVIDGRVNFSAPAADVVAALEALPGLGPWTAQYVALRALAEPDALPAADLVVRRMAGPSCRPLTPTVLRQRAQSWRPWRSYAVMHLWCAAGEHAQAARPRKGEAS
jgi:AraC family transcriptional regulator of adaptative response / DNA-3-methyladenine glycosylase II